MIFFGVGFAAAAPSGGDAPFASLAVALAAGAAEALCAGVGAEADGVTATDVVVAVAAGALADEAAPVVGFGASSVPPPHAAMREEKRSAYFII